MDYKNMRKLFVAIIMLTALAVNAQDVVSLAGMWKFRRKPVLPPLLFVPR